MDEREVTLCRKWLQELTANDLVVVQELLQEVRTAKQETATYLLELVNGIPQS